MDEIIVAETLAIEKVKTQREVLQELSVVDEDYTQYLEGLNPRQVRRTKQAVNGLRNGLYAIAPLICAGPGKCLFFDRCPIPEIDPLTGEVDVDDMSKYPIGRGCLLEKFFMQQKVIEYIQYLDVDPANPIEMAIANDLAIIDLYKYRAVAILSSGDKDGTGQDFMRTDIIGFNEETGQAAQMTRTHPALEVIDKLEKRRESYIDKLNESRRAKMELAFKLGQGKDNSKVLEEVSKLREAISRIANGKTIEIPVDETEVFLEGAL